MRITKENTIAVLIDVQERLFPHIYDSQQLALNTVRLIDGLNILQVPIIVTEQYTKGLGRTIAMLEESLDKYEPIEKITFSCCGEPNFLSALANSGKKNVLVFGIEAHVCVLQTTIDLLANNFKVIVIEDCISSRKPNDKTIAVERFKSEGAMLSTYESILFELCQTAGTETFKAISKLVK